MLTLTESGLYCEPGDFFIDPWQPVDRAIITHAHSDHARPGSRHYLAARPGGDLLRARLGPGASVETVDYGATIDRNGVRLALLPAGHILGSAQVRLEHRGEVWVVSGDYKLESDPTCAPFEPVRCHTFVTESTFGLPIYRWAPQEEIFAGINEWWRTNRDRGTASVIYGYALGKAQRILAGVDAAIGPIFTHGAVERLNQIYRAVGVHLPATRLATPAAPAGYAGAMVIAPPSAKGSPWMRRFGPLSTAWASGWMRIRGARRRRSVDRGFVLSDHADWPGLNQAIEATGANSVWVTHGYRDPLARWLQSKGLEAKTVDARFDSEQDESDPSPAEEIE